MPTLILTPRFTEDAQALWLAAGRLGWDVQRLTSWRIPDDIRSVPDPVLYLEGLVGPTLAEQFGLRLLVPPEDWLPGLPEEFRKRWIYSSTLGQARSIAAPAFVKPPNDKSFPARVYASSELPLDYEESTPVLVAEPVVWEKEFRCFVLNRQLRTLSVYLRDGEHQRANDFAQSSSEIAEARVFVEAILTDSRVDLPRTAVIDVGVIASRGWAVVEQNAAWGSGIYGCDPEQVLEVIRFATDPI